MNTLKHIHVAVFLCLTCLTINCKKNPFKSIDELLPLYQWRKTEVAIYSLNGDLEAYIFQFDNAEDCEKNSCLKFGRYITDTSQYSSIYYKYNLCNSFSMESYNWFLNEEKDSIKFTVYNQPLNIISKYYIESYDNDEFVLRNDTIIEEKKKYTKTIYSSYGERHNL